MDLPSSNPTQSTSATSAPVVHTPYGDVPASQYQAGMTSAQIQTIASSTPASTLATTWKPDFNKPNPYEGMPADYAKLVESTFVPTKETPKSPIQTAQEAGWIKTTEEPAKISLDLSKPPAGPAADTSADKQLKQLVSLAQSGKAPWASVNQYIKENPQAARGAYGNWIEEQLGQQYKKAYSLTGRELFEALKALGELESEAVYIPDPKSKQGFQTMSKSAFERLPEDVQKAFHKSWKEGISVIDEYNKQVETQQVAQNMIKSHGGLIQFVINSLNAKVSDKNIMQTLNEAGYDKEAFKQARALYDLSKVSGVIIDDKWTADPLAAIQAKVSKQAWVDAGYSGDAYDEAVKFDKEQQEYEKKLKDLQENYVPIANNQWIPKDQWQDLVDYDAKYGTDYTTIAKTKGWETLNRAIKADERARELATIKMEEYKTTDEGYNLALAIVNGVTPEEMKLAGFEQSDIDRATKTVQTSKETGVAVEGDVQWERVTGEILSDAEFKKQIDQNSSERDLWHKTVPTGRRQAIQVLSTIFSSPIRIALPEVEAADISALEYGLGAAQAALWFTPIMPAKAITIPLTGAIFGGLNATLTTQNWSKLSTPEKAMGVGFSLLALTPALISVAKVARPVAVKIPLKDGGTATIWKGYSVKGKPIVGISEGKPVFGTGGITKPAAGAIAEGYRPITKVETTLMGTRKAMAEVGMSQEGIDRVFNALQIESHVKGQKSPYLPKQGEIKPVKSLSVRSVAEILQETQDKNNKVKQIYGSMTIREQLKPELRGWRVPADIDIQTSLTPDELKEFAKKLLRKLEQTEGKGKFKIDPAEPGLIQRWDKGGWHNAVDIHGIEPITQTETIRTETLASISKSTGDYTYGIRVTRPSVKINYPGIGKVKMMSLAESQKRKLDAILRWRGPKTVAPEEHRVKDIVDFYVIAKTFKNVPDEQLKEFLRLWGLTVDDVEKLSAEYPTRLGMFEFEPTAKSAKGSPTVSISVPSYLTKVMPSLARALQSSSPVTNPSTSASLGSASEMLSPSAAGIVSPSGKLSLGLIVSPSVSPRTKASTLLASISPKVSPSVSPKPSPSVTPSVTPSVSPALSPGLTAIPSPSPVPSPSVSPVPSPSLYPSPYPGTEEPPPRPVLVTTEKGEKRYKITPGSIAWKQGIFWKYIPPPWTQEKPISLRYPPVGAKHTEEKTPEKTIQMIGKAGAEVPKTASVDLGVVDIYISDYGKNIKFSGGGEKTTVGTTTGSPTSGMAIGEAGKLTGAGTSDEALRKLPLGTTVDQLIREVYNDKIPKKTADRMLSSKLSKMSPKEIADQLTASLSTTEKRGKDTRREEILKMLPDSVREQVEFWENVQTELAPTKGWPKYQRTNYLHRKPSTKRKKKKAVFVEPMTQMITPR